MPFNMGKKAVLYARVSTDEQRDNGFSLQDQISRMQKHCRSNDYDILQVLEEDHSAKNFNRPVFQRFLTDLKAGAIKPTVFVCVRPDRFSRNVQQTFEMFATLKKLGVNVAFLESHVDVNNPVDLLLLYINQILPEIDNARRSLNVTRGMRQARREGRWMGPPLRGYKMEKQGNTSLMIPNEKAKVIVQGFEMFASGLHSQEEVRLKLRTLGVHVSRFQIKNVLTNIAYTGKILIPAWKDEPETLVDGLHEGIISDELFKRVQDVLHGRKHHPTKFTKRSDSFPLRGYLECSQCGGKLTASSSKSRNGSKHPYYHCRKGCKERFKADDAHQSFQGLLASFKMPDEIMSLYYHIMQDIFRKDEDSKKAEVEGLENQIAQVQSRLNNAQDSFFDGVIDQTEFTKVKARYQEQLDELSFRQMRTKFSKSHFQQYLDFGFSLLTDLDRYFDEASLEVKQKMLGSIFPEKLIFDGKKCRTARPTQLLSLLTMNINELGEIKKDFPDMQSEKSSKVTLIANLSNQLFQDLANLYELQPFVKVSPFQPLKQPATNSLRIAV